MQRWPPGSAVVHLVMEGSCCWIYCTPPKEVLLSVFCQAPHNISLCYLIKVGPTRATHWTEQFGAVSNSHAGDPVVSLEGLLVLSKVAGNYQVALLPYSTWLLNIAHAFASPGPGLPLDA